MLDSEPGYLQQQQQPEEQQQQHGDRQEEDRGERYGEQREEPGQGELEQQPLIPLPVILAMEMKTNAGPKQMFGAAQLSSVEKPQYTPKWMTVDGGGDVGTDSVSSRGSLIRQANNTSDQIDNEDTSPSDGWMPKIPVFAKCPPAKSKSKYRSARSRLEFTIKLFRYPRSR
jgi:hypothetical protein